MAAAITTAAPLLHRCGTDLTRAVVLRCGWVCACGCVLVCSQNEKERETAQMILDSLIKWSIECTQVNQTAHIVFVADNAFTADILSRSTSRRLLPTDR